MCDVEFTERDFTDHIGVGGVIKNDEGDVLLLWHNKFQVWTVPMGKGEEGESAEEALRAELFEEVGIVVIDAEIIGRHIGRYARPTGHVEVDCVLFLVEDWVGHVENKEPAKHNEVRWATDEEILHMPDAKISDLLKMYKDGLTRKAA